MDLCIKILALFFPFSTLYIQVSVSEIVRAYCFETETGYRVMFRLKKDQPEDSVIEGLEAYDASIDPLTQTPVAASGSGCSTSTSEPGINNVFALSFEFDTSSPTCGSDGDTVLIKATGKNKFWEIPCSDPNVIPREIFENNIGASKTDDFHHHLPNPFDIKFQAFEANGYNTPLTYAYIEQDILLRLIFNTGQIEFGPVNWGMVFCTGFVPYDTATGLTLQIVTPGLGTKVHITGKLPGHELDLWVSVKRDSAVEVNIPTAYMETDATRLDWTIQSRGIKIESMHDRIGVRSITKNVTGSSFTLSPVSILGLEYNGLALIPDQSPPEISENIRLVEGATENSGFIEVFHDNEWRPVCDDLDGPDEALVACRSLGYADYSTFTKGSYSGNVIPFWLDGVNCDGTESSLEECSHNDWGVHDCLENERFFVTCSTESRSDSTDDYIIVAVEDGTSVDIVYNDYDPRDNLDVDGVDADTGISTDGVILNEYDILHIRCASGKCSQLKFLSNKPISVMLGSGVTSQLIPVVNYDDYFVLITTSGGTQQYIAQHEDSVITADVNYDDYFALNLTFNNFPFVTSYNTEHRIEFPVGYYLHQVSGPNGPFLLPMISIDQWGVFNYFYAVEGATYSLIFVGSIGDVANITFKTGSVTTNLIGSTLGEQPGFSTSVLGALFSRANRYERYNVIVNVTDNRSGTDQGLIEFRGASPRSTFLMIIEEYTESSSSVYLPFGVRYPTSNPCVPTSLARPGDLINNDCDEFTDEEILNGLDDDGDGQIDEDPAPSLVSPTGIYASELSLCTDALCTSRKLIHKFGCFNYDNYGDGGYLDIGPFEHNTDLADEFDNYYVIDTPPFDAFRYVNDGTIDFMVTYGLCNGDLAKCENSCLDTAEKRSVQEVFGVRLSLPVIRNDTNIPRKSENTDNGRQKPRPCSNKSVLWVTMLLLLAILFVEVVATMFFSYKWYQFRRMFLN